MIYLLFGPDSYRSRKKLNEIIKEYKKVHKSGLSLVFIDCEETNINIEDLKDRTRQTSIFKEKKLIVITNLFSNASLKEGFQKSIKDFLDSEDIIVVYENKEIKKSEPLLKLLKKETKCQEFKALSGAQLKNWLKKEFEINKVKIDSQAMDLLLEYVGEDLWQLSNEIQKLANFKKSKSITTADIKLLVKPKIETNIFKTIDAIAQKNKKQALNLIRQHLEEGDSPPYLLSMINYQFRNLLIIKDLIERDKPYNIILKKSGLHPFVVKKTYSQARLFPLNELKKIYSKIFETDLKIKTGRIEPEMALELLIAEI